MSSRRDAGGERRQSARSAAAATPATTTTRTTTALFRLQKSLHICKSREMTDTASNTKQASTKHVSSQQHNDECNHRRKKAANLGQCHWPDHSGQQVLGDQDLLALICAALDKDYRAPFAMVNKATFSFIKTTYADFKLSIPLHVITDYPTRAMCTFYLDTGGDIQDVLNACGTKIDESFFFELATMCSFNERVIDIAIERQVPGKVNRDFLGRVLDAAFGPFKGIVPYFLKRPHNKSVCVQIGRMSPKEADDIVNLFKRFESNDVVGRMIVRPQFLLLSAIGHGNVPLVKQLLQIEMDICLYHLPVDLEVLNSDVFSRSMMTEAIRSGNVEMYDLMANRCMTLPKDHMDYKRMLDDMHKHGKKVNFWANHNIDTDALAAVDSGSLAMVEKVLLGHEISPTRRTSRHCPHVPDSKEMIRRAISNHHFDIFLQLIHDSEFKLAETLSNSTNFDWCPYVWGTVLFPFDVIVESDNLEVLEFFCSPDINSVTKPLDTWEPGLTCHHKILEYFGFFTQNNNFIFAAQQAMRFGATKVLTWIINQAQIMYSKFTFSYDMADKLFSTAIVTGYRKLILDKLPELDWLELASIGNCQWMDNVSQLLHECILRQNSPDDIDFIVDCTYKIQHQLLCSHCPKDASAVVTKKLRQLITKAFSYAVVVKNANAMKILFNMPKYPTISIRHMLNQFQKQNLSDIRAWKWLGDGTNPYENLFKIAEQAANTGHCRLLKILIDAKVPIISPSGECTLLAHAAAGNNVSAIELLLNEGAKLVGNSDVTTTAARAATTAAEHNQLSAFLYLQSKGCPIVFKHCMAAIDSEFEFGVLETFEQCNNNGSWNAMQSTRYFNITKERALRLFQKKKLTPTRHNENTRKLFQNMLLLLMNRDDRYQ